MADVSIKFDTKFDAKAFEKGLKDVESKMASFSKSTNKLGDNFSSVGKRGGKSFSGLNSSVGKSSVKFRGFTKVVGAAMAAVTALVGALAAGGLAKSFLQTAARTETLTVAMESVARANGISTEAMNEHKAAVMDMGIAEQEATQIMTRFMQAQLDTADAAKLARVAQDAAVIANVDSSQAAETMTEAIAKQRPELLSSFGMTRNLNAIYGDYSSTLGKTTQQLSEAEKSQAIMNYIMQEGTRITGTYEASMGTAGKQIGSLSRHWQTFSNTIATPFLPALAKAVEGVTNALVGATAWLEANISTLERWGQTLADIIGLFVKTEKKASASSSRATGSVMPKEVSNQTKPIDEQTKALGKQGKAIEDNAKKAKKASKQLQSFDQLNRMQSEDDSSSGGSSGGGAGGSGGAGGAIGSGINPSDYSMEPRDLGADLLESSLDRLAKKLRKFAEEWGLINFFDKIKEGFDKVDWGNIKDNLGRIATSWGNIGVAAGGAIKEIVAAAAGLAGTVYGHMIAIVGNIVDMLVEGYAEALEEMEEELIEWIGETGDKIKEGIENVTKTYDLLGSILLGTLEKYRGRIVGATKKTFTNAGRYTMLFGTVVSDVYNQVTGRILKFLEDNEEDVQLYVDNVAEIFLGIWDSFNMVVDDLLTIWEDFWNDHGEGMVDVAITIFEDFAEMVIYQFNEVIKPAWDTFIEGFTKVWNENIKPLIEPALEFVAKLVNLVGVIWSNFIYPIIKFIQTVLAPIWRFVFGLLSVIVTSAVTIITDIIGGLIKTFSGIIDFITGVLTGDWELAWEGIKDIFIGVFETMLALVKQPANAIISMINGLVGGVTAGINLMIDALNGLEFEVPDWVPMLGGKEFNLGIATITAPKIPHLAKGGLIPPRKPRPVIVGDNMVEDEIVSPVSTMQKALSDVLVSQGGVGNNQQLIQVLLDIRNLLEEGSVIEMNDREFGRAVQKAARDIRRQTGISLT